MLSAIDKLILLKEVPFFAGMSLDQLRVVVSVCEEQVFAAGTRIFAPGDPGGVLYIVVTGQVAIEQAKAAGAIVRLDTKGAYTSFGEMNLFDGAPHRVAAIALQDTLTLRLPREPLLALSRLHPELLLELINMLSQNLHAAQLQITSLSRARPRKLQRLLDQFE